MSRKSSLFKFMFPNFDYILALLSAFGGKYSLAHVEVLYLKQKNDKRINKTILSHFYFGLLNTGFCSQMHSVL